MCGGGSAWRGGGGECVEGCVRCLQVREWGISTESVFAKAL